MPDRPENQKHTPGPWSICWYDAGDRDYYDHNGPCPSIQAPKEYDCAIVHWDGFKQQYWSSASGDQRQIEANARLIAAAPELLAFAQAWLAMEESEGWEGPYIDMARAAISKALGQHLGGEGL